MRRRNMNITININAPELVNAIQSLATALSGTKLEPVKIAPAIEPEVKAETNKPRTRTKPEPETKVEPEPTITEEPATEESTDPENVPTVVDLRAKAQEKGKTSADKAAIKALLNEYKSKSISDVPEESRVAFLAALEDL
jgi:outer membrane biosynthesis protein TonB